MAGHGSGPLPDNAQGRALLFRQLAAVEDAGIPPQQALVTLQRDASPALGKRLAKATEQLHLGQAPGEALSRAGLCQHWESEFLQAMHGGGRLGEGYGYLASQLETRALRLARLKSRLALPVLVFILALFITPLPALARGDLTVPGYLARSFLPLVLLAVFGKMLDGLLRRESLAIALLRRLPVYGPLVQRQHELHSLAVLGLLLRSGLPASRAIELAATASTAWPSASVGRAVALTAKGEALATALTANGLCSDAGDRALLVGAESAGKLDETLARIALLRQETLDVKLDLWADWLPRLLYFAAFLPWVL
jgi:type II secretory pathway component PulF